MSNIKDVKAENLIQKTAEQLKKEIINLGGTSPEFFEQKDVEEVFLPILRNDFRIFETHRHLDNVAKIDTGITVFYGKEDIEENEVIGWKKRTEKECNIYDFPGGHFFIKDNLKQIIGIICNTLKYQD